MTIRDSWEALKAERAAFRLSEDALDARIERFVAWVSSLSKVAAGVPPEEVAPPAVVPAPFLLSPAPSGEPSKPSIEPSGSAPSWEPTRGVKATMWRDRADERPMVEGGDPPRMGNGVLCQPGDGWRFAWVSLPAQIRDGIVRRIWLRLTSSPFAPVSGPYPQADIGPWWDGTRGTKGSYSPDLEDHWWDGAPTRRPRVELEERDARGRVDNGAGIDLTPRAGAEVVKAAGQHPEVTVEQLAMRYYENPGELKVDVWVEELPAGQAVHDGPSPHFTWTEVSRSATADEKGINNDVPADVRPGVVQFAAGIVEPLRAALGRPMRFGADWTSWYRSPALNAAVGGSSTSDHLTGRGLDVPRTEEFWRALRAAKTSLPLLVNVEPDHYDLKVGIATETLPVNWIEGAIKAVWEI